MMMMMMMILTLQGRKTYPLPVMDLLKPKKTDVVQLKYCILDTSNHLGGEL